MLPETTLMTTRSTFQKKDAAQKIIKNRTLYAAGVGLIPIPMVDAAGITGIQLWMIRDLSKVYNIPFKHQLVKSFIGSLVSNMGALGMVKLIPGVGSILGGTTVAISAATATYALGQLFMQHFDQGGTLLTFDPIQSRVYFQKLYEEGNEAVEKLKKEKTEQLSTYKAALYSLRTLKKENHGLKEQKAYYLSMHEMNEQSVQELQKINEQLKADVTDRLALKEALAEKESEQLTAAQSVAVLQQSNADLKAKVAQLQEELELYRKQKANGRKKRLAILLLPLLLLLLVGAWWWTQESNLFGKEDSATNLVTTNLAAQNDFMTEDKAVNSNSNKDILAEKRADNSIVSSEVRAENAVATSTLVTKKIKLNFNPRSSEAEIADFLNTPNVALPKTFWMRKIYFEENVAVPHPSSNQQIENMAVLMQQYPYLTIRIYGEVKDNKDKAVGIKQANAIKELLHQKGIAQNRMLTSYIYKRTLADDNRRIEIEILNRD